jgi:autotransporter-associated beta strand protein
MFNSHFFLNCIFFCLIIFSSTAYAAAISWVAQNPNNDMNNSANWNPSTIPGSSDNAIFNSNIFAIDTNPTENFSAFSVSTFNFPFNASIFDFNFNNQKLTFNGAGITGSNTNPSITVTNTNNSSFPGDLVSFIGGTGTSGSSLITISNSGTLTGNQSGAFVGPINSNLHSDGSFIIANGGIITASNTGNDSTNGTGNNGAANTGASQLQFDQSFSAGDNVAISLLNRGTFSGTNTVQGDAVAIINGSQFISSGPFQIGDNFDCEVQNFGNDSSFGVGLSNIGQMNAAQMILQTTATVGNDCTITVSNNGINSSQTTNFPDFIGYLNDQQFFVGDVFQAGDNLNVTVSNTGTDTSNGYGGYQVAVINSNSGTTGNQILFQQGCTLGDHAAINITNSGTYSGANTNGGSTIAGMNLQQIAIGNSTAPGTFNFVAGDYFNLSASNSGIDSSHGTGGNAIGDVSSDQITFFAPASLGNYANMTITNSGIFSGNASTMYVNVGSAGASQLNCVSSLSVGDNFTLSVSNSGTNTGSGIGGYFIGDLIDGQQVTFQNNFIIGNNASLTISNSGSNSSNTTTNNQVGSFMGYGKQLLAKNLFQIGDDFFLEITNSGFDDSIGPGGNFVGFMNNNTADNSASQVHLANGGIVGDLASITLSNTGTYQGSNTTSANLIGVFAGQQLYSVSDFHAGNNFTLTVSNAGTDNAEEQNNNSVGTVGSSQVQFDGVCVIGNNASISLTNNGTNNDPTGIFNNIGVINGSQLLVNGNFTAGTILNISANNKVINENDPSNFVGYLSASQLVFNESCTLNNGSIISAFNSGTVGNSQIIFGQGFNVASGSVTIQAINQGTIGSFGIDIQGSNTGGSANIVLSNSSLNIGTTLSTFTVASLGGDSTSIVQSQPQLIINTEASTQSQFSGVIQNFPATMSQLVKRGAGTQILSGDSTYTGSTTVEAGALIMNGSLVSDVQVNASGTLGGSGTFAGSIINAGSIAPGRSIGTMTILGDFTNNGGSYDLEVGANTSSDRIDVSGTSTINGGTVYLSSPDGQYTFQQPYTILHTANLSGIYSEVLPLSPSLHPILNSDLHNIYVTLETAIIQVAQTPNQVAVANRLDGIVSPNANQTLLLSQMVDLTPTNAQEALDSLSGYQHTDDFWTTQVINRQFIRRLYDPIRCIVTDGGISCANPCDRCTNPDWTFWVEGGGGYSSLRENRNAHGFHMNSAQVTMGFQKTCCSILTGGIAGSYEYDHLHYLDGGSGKNNTWLVGLYGLCRPRNFYGLVDVSYGQSIDGIHRAISVGSLSYKARSKPRISQGTVYGEFGGDLHEGCLLVQPFAGIEVGAVHRNSLKEKESHGWALSIRHKQWTTTTSRLGMHLTMNGLSKHTDISLSLDVAWNRLLSCHKNAIRGEFINFGSAYQIQGVNLGRDSIDYALTLSACFTSKLRTYLEFSGESWQNLTTSNGVLGLTVNW